MKQWVTVSTPYQIVFLRFITLMKHVFLDRTTKQREGFVAEFITFNKGTKVLVEVPVEMIKGAAVALTNLTDWAPTVSITIATEKEYELVVQKWRGSSEVIVSFGCLGLKKEYPSDDVPHLLFRL